jgi:phosphoribosyl-AMP cyclohydrolase
MNDQWLDEVKWNSDGLVPVIVTEISTAKILMLAWMNREALMLTAATGQAVYWSRSRGKLWHKGEQSGHVQYVKEIRLDCDEDAIMLVVEQQGGIACHTGRHSCFFRKLQDKQWRIIEPVIKDPAEIYHNSDH